MNSKLKIVAGRLTIQERDGLNDVFLAIHSRSSRYEKLKEISSLILMKQSIIAPLKLLKSSKNRLKKRNFLFLARYFDFKLILRKVDDWDSKD